MNNGLVKAVRLEKNKTPIMERGGRALHQHAVMYIVDGHGHFEDIHTPRRQVGPGTVFYLFPDRWHRFDPDPGTAWCEYWVLFDGRKAAERFGDLLPAGSPVHDVGIVDRIKESYEHLYETWSASYRPDEKYISYLLHRILGELYIRINKVNPVYRDNTVTRAVMLSRARLGKNDIDFKRFAGTENISYQQFRKRFQKEMSLPPKKYFLMLKVNRAKELLANPALSVKEIAYSLGFADEYYFSRLFKIKEGVSPRQYRETVAPRPAADP